MVTNKFSLIKIFLVVFLLVYGILGINNIENFWILSSVNLPFHELGHFLLSGAGEMLQFFGGTIAQLTLPILIMTYFIFKQDYYASAVVLFWLSENFLEIANYVRDAETQNLPLLIEGSLHDWHYILANYGVLKYSQTIANTIFAFGITLLFISIFWGLLTAKTNKLKI